MAEVQLTLLNATARNVGRSPTVATLGLVGSGMLTCRGGFGVAPLLPRGLGVVVIQLTMQGVTARTGAVTR